MNLITNSWRSLLDLLDNFSDFLESLSKEALGRFILGCIAAIVPVLVYWGYALFFGAPIPLIQGIIGSLILMFSFGIVAVYGDFSKFLEDLNL